MCQRHLDYDVGVNAMQHRSKSTHQRSDPETTKFVFVTDIGATICRCL